MREILAVEQRDGIGRRRCRWPLGAGIDDGRPGAIHRMDRPLLCRHGRRRGDERWKRQPTECGMRNSHERSLAARRSEEHTSELQSLAYLVCRLLLEKKKKKNTYD